MFTDSFRCILAQTVVSWPQFRAGANSECMSVDVGHESNLEHFFCTKVSCSCQFEMFTHLFLDPCTDSSVVASDKAGVNQDGKFS